ncbi:hypothetical protein ACHAXT_000444 [Thalassiosira profunda]
MTSNAIAWSCVARDGVILAEAGADDGSGKVIRTAQKINKMKPTAGWEKTRTLKDAPFRGLKLHVHEATEEDEGDISGSSQQIIVWTFCCVYDCKRITEQYAQAFLTKLSFVTEPLRGMPWWREGGVLSAQESFAPTLQQQLESAERDGQLAMISQHVDETKELMAKNIHNILERGEKLEDLEEEAQELNAMARVFKKNAKKVKRFKMWQNAKHGVLVGTAITGAVGVAVIPPLIALL